MNEVVIKVIGNYSYQTSRCLGEGVYGKVYEGTERETKQKVAIKKIDLATFTNDKYLENAIFSEIYLLKRFNHLNIVKFKDVLSSKNSLYIITEYCKNGDLKELIKRKRFKEEEVFEIIKQIVNGFTELIKEKIIHRDLKPANILINEGVYKIGDFGFAKYVDNFGSQMLKSCVGSPIYMAPQILQRTQYTTKCDIWSMGIIFYEMIFGYPPWKARDEYELLRGIKTISISQIIKRENLSTKASDFLKRTLAYSEQERISWQELFEMFSGTGSLKTESKSEITQEKGFSSSSGNNSGNNNGTISGSGKDRGRITSGNWNSSQKEQSSQNKNSGVTPTLNTANITSVTNTKTEQLLGANSNTSSNIKDPRDGSSSPLNSPDRRRTSLGGIPTMNTTPSNSQSQLEMIVNSRQFCIYYSFYCLQLFVKYSFMKNTVGMGSSGNANEMFSKLLLTLSLCVRNKSTFALSNLSLSLKESKTLEELNKKMKVEHESYQTLYNDIVAMLEKEGVYRKVKDDLGRSDVINEKKIEEIEGQLAKVSHENAQILSEEVKKRGKSIKDFTLVEVLDFVLDVLALSASKNKTQVLKEIREAKSEEQDLKDYLSRVVNKVDKISVYV